MSQCQQFRARRATAALSGAILAAVLFAPAAQAAESRVVATGVQVDYGDQVNQTAAMPGGGPALTVNDICNNADMLGQQLQGMLMVLDAAAAESGAPITPRTIENIPGAPNRYDLADDLSRAREALCNQPEPRTTVQPFTVSYSSCRMTMTLPAQEMSITLPPGGGKADMWLVDHNTREIVYVELASSLHQASGAVGTGWNAGLDIQPVAGGAQDVFGYATNKYTFSHTGGLGSADAGAVTQADLEAGNVGASNLGNLVSVTTEGTAWLAPDAPGVGIVKSFYENLTGTVQPGPGTSFFSGMLMNQVKMLEYGMPIIIDQEISSKIMGRTAISGRSETHVANIRVLPLEANWCDVAMEAPPGYKMTDVNEQMQAAMGAGTGAGSADAMSEAMAQYQEAMDQMTPEQQAMMQQLGMGDMLGQSGGGGAAAAGAGATAAAAPSADSLTTGNTTESAQNLLTALGYDPGEASGETSLATQIAISEFQADHGLDVTGEVTPQLIGVLSAELDKRSGR